MLNIVSVPCWGKAINNRYERHMSELKLFPSPVGVRPLTIAKELLPAQNS